MVKIYISQSRIRGNKMHGSNEPVITVSGSTGDLYSNEVIIYGQDGLEAARVVYRPESPSSCGAKAWVEASNGYLCADNLPPAFNE